MAVVTIKQGCICGRDISGNGTAKFLCGHCNVLYEIKMIGLFIGRFQPFHNGHLEVIRRALKEVSHIIIIITVPLRKTSKDPFSADERREMIRDALHEEKIRNFSLFVVNDIPSDDEYVDHVRQHAHNFNMVYVGENRINEKLFSDAGYTVIASNRYFNISSTDVREDMLRNGDKWKKMVPKAVAEYIERKELEKKVTK